MTVPQPESGSDELGPVDFLAIEFPGGRLTAPGFEKLLSLADQGVVEILDMVQFPPPPTAATGVIYSLTSLHPRRLLSVR